MGGVESIFIFSLKIFLFLNKTWFSWELTKVMFDQVRELMYRIVI